MYLDNVWLTLQTCMNQIIENDGGNEYRLVHMNKKLEHEGLLPRSIFPTEIHPAFSDDNNEVAVSNNDGNNEHDGSDDNGSDNNDNYGVVSIGW